uniref:E3 ubiquitin-protein ligase HUWE1 n=1 Tax=Syphacia muris TaxID=451379 RepID=A0A0N5ALW3_9BILA
MWLKSMIHHYILDVLQIDNISNQLSLLLKHCAKLPKKSYILRIPYAEKTTGGCPDAFIFIKPVPSIGNIITMREVLLTANAAIHLEPKKNKAVPADQAQHPKQLAADSAKAAQATQFEFRPMLQVVAPPTAFGVTALARTIVLRYGSLLENINESGNLTESFSKYKPIIPDLGVLKEQSTPGGNQLITLGLKCIFSVLTELNKRDPELCSQALSSLLQLIQNMPVDTLTSETYKSVQNMYDMLKQLRLHGKKTSSIVCGYRCVKEDQHLFQVSEFSQKTNR